MTPRLAAALAGRNPKRRRKPPRQVQPRAQRAAYRRRLEAVVDLAGALVRQRLGPVLAKLEQGERNDAREGGGEGTFAKRDADPADEVRRVLAGVRLEWSKLFDDEAAEKLVEPIGEDVRRHNRRQVRRQLEAALGLDVLRGEESVQPQVRQWVRENVALIVTQGPDTFADIEKHAVDAVLKGLTNGEGTRLLNERLKTRRWFACRIARDQVNKLNGELTASRNKAAGIEKYTWVHSGNRVNPRPEHQARDGKVFEWAHAPEGGHPGTEILCGCTSVPVVE